VRHLEFELAGVFINRLAFVTYVLYRAAPKSKPLAIRAYLIINISY